MSRAVGWAVGAAIVSITIGILVGLVLHTGQIERADRPPPAGAAVARSSVTGTPTGTLTPATSRTGTASGQPSSALPPPAPPSTAVPSTTLLPPPVAPITTSPVTAPPAPSGVTGTPPSAVTAAPPGAATGTAASPPSGSATAGGPCPALAARAADAAGTTLYCQVDRGDRTLRWRAVVNGGGCLNQSMTGTGADGVTYRCRLDASGLNHWAPAG